MRGAREALLLLVAVAALRSATLVTPIFIHDEACIAMQAQTLLDGGRLYVDTADRKPPLVPLLYAAVFAVHGSADMIAVHVLAILIVFLTALVLAREAGPAAGWLYVAASTAFLPTDGMAAGFELFMLLPYVAAMWLARRHDTYGLLLAGACVALATLCKQTGFVALAPVLVRAWRVGRVRAVALVLASCSATLATAACYFGARELLFWTVSGNGGYLAADGILGYVIPRAITMTAFFGASTFGIWWLVARAWSWREEHVEWWIWLAAGAIAVVAGFRFFGHYYFHLVPPACALAASALPRVSGRMRRASLGYTAIAAVAYAALGFWGRTLHGLPDYRPLAAEIQRRTTPRDRVLLWGNFPEVLWAADRRSSSRFVHMNFVTGVTTGRAVGPETRAAATPGALDMLRADLAAHPPALVIDTSPANLRDDGAYPMSDFPVLADYVARNFRATAKIDSIVIYERVTN